MKKVYYESEQEAIDANQAEAKKRGCDMTTTTMWWQMGKDDGGWHLIVDDESKDGDTTIEP